MKRLTPFLRFNIRRRLILLFLLLSFLPLLAYRFAVDLQHLLLTHQAHLHQHTVQNLALILESRPELWGQTTAAGQVLSHIDFDTASIWIVNSQGQTSYVMGQLQTKTLPTPWLAELGDNVIKLLSHVFNPLPYPFPQSATPEVTLIQQALNGQKTQQYRTNHSGEPISLMSASPLFSQNQLIGALVYEQSLDTIFNQTLQHFHRLIGVSSLLLLAVLFGILIYSSALSKRILNLRDEVKQTFTQQGRLSGIAFSTQDRAQDEIAELRQSIGEMLEKIAGYDRYLKKLPTTLRHELHNPLNRLQAGLDRLALASEQDKVSLQQSQQALNQLKHIIQLLSDASSLEQSLLQQKPLVFNVVPRLAFYFSGVQQSLQPGLVVVDNQLSVKTFNVLGEGFLLEQLFDKLIDNALEFNNQTCPILVTLKQVESYLIVSVCNCGVLLPSGLEKQIFDGMVSVRQLNHSSQTHLGLGLYIARLIADFHQAKIEAKNKPDNSGVCFELIIPRAHLNP